MHIKLNKPLIFIDIESTGLNIGLDRIVEISLLKLNPDNTTEIRTDRINPEMPIPDFVSKIHGIYTKDISEALTFKQLAPELLRFIDNGDFAGFNSNKFDIPMLAEEFLRAEVDFDLEGRKLIDVQNIFHFMEPRNLSAAYKFYCNKNIENAPSDLQTLFINMNMDKSQLFNSISMVNKINPKYTPIFLLMYLLRIISVKIILLNLYRYVFIQKKSSKITKK